MTDKRREQKAEYERIKDIRNRIATGQTTTFIERNIVNIYLKKLAKKQKLSIANS